jgi:hypothetical protein
MIDLRHRLIKSNSADLVDMFGQVNHSVGVSPFVIVPGNDLMEVLVQRKTGMHVED